MGAWGFGIRQDDFVLDVIGAVEDLLKSGKSVREATESLRSTFAGDAEADPLLWIALADVQWTYGDVESGLRDRVRKDFDSGRSLAAWADDQRGLSRRKTVLEKFIARIAKPNPRPRKLPKVVVRAPRFSSGDCLSIRLSNGQHGAALVLATDHTNVEYGKDLVGVLDYRAPEKPALDVFRKRRWATEQHHDGRASDIAWYFHMGFRTVKNRLEVVGKVEILDSDPKDSSIYRRWTGIGDRRDSSG